MPYGIKIYGDGGDLVIDDDYEAYAFLGNYTLTFTGNGTDPYNTSGPLYPVYHNYRCDIVSTSRPLVFYQPPRGSYTIGGPSPMFASNQQPGIALVAMQNIGSNTWRCYFVAPWVGIGGATTIKAFVSTKSLGASTNPVGIRTRNSAGDLTFDSGWRVLNPRTGTVNVTRIQENVSNVIGTAITFNGTNDGIPSLLPDAWISAFTREPTITTVVQPSTALVYTYAFKVFTQVYYPSNNSFGSMVMWPAVVNNSTFPAYNAVFGSNQNTTISYLWISNDNMTTYYS